MQLWLMRMLLLSFWSRRMENILSPLLPFLKMTLQVGEKRNASCSVAPWKVSMDLKGRAPWASPPTSPLMFWLCCTVIAFGIEWLVDEINRIIPLWFPFFLGYVTESQVTEYCIQRKTKINMYRHPRDWTPFPNPSGAAAGCAVGAVLVSSGQEPSSVLLSSCRPGSLSPPESQCVAHPLIEYCLGKAYCYPIVGNCETAW